ncbi:unnamed protein product, partial [Sphagnum compactum]
MLPPAPYQGHSYSSLKDDDCNGIFVLSNKKNRSSLLYSILEGFEAPVLRLVGRVERLKFPEGSKSRPFHLLQHSTLVRQHKRTGSNRVSIYYILVHMKLGTAAMFVLSALACTRLV